MGLFSKESTFDPMAQYTPQQRQAVEALMSLAATGSGGGITLGEQYGKDIGSYDPTQLELSGLMKLTQGLQDGPNQDLAKARETFTGLADMEFDPSDPRSGFASFARQLARAQSEAADVLNREAAITGSRFGTGIQKQKRELAERGSDAMASELARLYQNTMSQRLAGAQGLTGLASTEAALDQQDLQNLFTMGSLERQLKDQKAKDEYGEFKRQREEKLSRINLMQDQWQNPMGTITKKGPSTFAKIFGQINPLMGSYNQARYGYNEGQITLGDLSDAALKIFTAGMGGGTNASTTGSKSASTIST